MGNEASVALCGNDPSFQKHTERGSSSSLKLDFAVSEMQGMRPTMEDQHLLVCGLTCQQGNATIELKDHSCFAVFDGHGGDFASKYVHDHFLQVFSKRPELAKYLELPETGNKSREDANGVTLLRQALTSTFYLLDAMLIRLQKERDAWLKRQHADSPPDLVEESDEEDTVEEEEKSKEPSPPVPSERSGSTGVVVLLTPSHLICANTGDSRALLRRTGTFLPLSFDHKPNEVNEKTRITSAGGLVKSRRIDGDLAVSRAFGDFAFKDDETLDPSQQKVTVTPDILVYPRRAEADEFIVLACDGVWDVANSGECVQFVQTMLGEGETDLGNICEEALDICLERNSRDNMTFMIVGFPAIKVDRSRAARTKNALWGTRTIRNAKNVSNNSAEAAKSGIAALGKEIGIEDQNLDCIQ